MTVEIIGGVGGLDARYDDMGAAARSLDTTGEGLVDLAVRTHLVAVDSDLVASAVLAPVSFARVEAAIVCALDGPDGVVAVAARLRVRALQLEVAVVRYRVADELDRQVTRWRRYLQGYAALAALPVALPVAALAATHPRLRAVLPDVTSEDFYVEHPEIVEEIVGTAPGFLSALFTFAPGPGLAPVLDAAVFATTGETLRPTTIEDATGLLGVLYPAGHAVVRHVGTDRRAEMAVRPTDLGALLTPLGARDRDARGTRQGEVAVRVITRTAADGRARTSYVVDIPGTRDWQFDPRNRPQLTDLATNLDALSGTPTARADGVAKALHAAGARPGDPVLLAGHSQGGMVAMRAAAEWKRTGEFNVTHVVTAGAPVAGMAVAESVRVLSLENRRDVVPQLDAAANRDRSNHTTVRFDTNVRGVVANHDMAGTYVPAARALSDPAYAQNPSVRDWTGSAGAFLARPGERVDVRVEVYDIRNQEGR
jgi:pimeloyl-ACP methyl ester carboxylesterase